MTKKLTKTDSILFWITPVILASVVLFARTESYLLFHSLAELFAIIVALMMSVVAWQMYPFTRNNYLLFLGCGYFWIAILDLMHALTFKDMNLFPAITGSNTTIQIWIATRYFEAGLLLAAPLFLTRNISRHVVFGLFAGIALSVFFLSMGNYLPTTYIEGQGLTAFKIYSEYTIVALLAVAMTFLWQKRTYLDQRIVTFMIASIGLTMLSELMFTLYLKVYDISNVMGHLFKLFSYWLIYVAVVRTTMREPFVAMARDISTYDSVPDAILALDEEGTVYQANQAALKLTGRDSHEVIGRHCHSVLHPVSRSPDSCSVCQYIEAMQTVNGITLYHSEYDKWFEYSLSTVGSDKKVTGMVQTIRDVTDKYIAKKEKSEAEQQIRMVLDSTYEAIYGIDMVGNCTFVNESCLNMLGFESENEVLGKNMHDLIHHHRRDGEDYPVEECHIYQAFRYKSGTHIDDEVLWRKDGSSFDAEYWSYPMYIDGACVGAVVTFIDITERRRAERINFESEKRLATAQAIAHVGHWNWDIENGRLSWSDEVFRIFGLEPQELEANYELFLEKVHEEDRKKVVNAVNGSLTDPENEYSVEHRIVRSNGTVRWVHETGEISYRNNKPIEMIGIVHDITDRKKTELMKLAYQDELENTVEERTAELTAANQQLQQLDHLKSMFIASMSHELRTPLNSIIGFTGVMLKGMSGELNEMQTDQLGRVQYSAKHLLSLISDIIDISKIEAGKVDIGVEEISLQALIEECLSNIEKLLMERGNKLVSKLDPQLVIHSDRTRLSQVLLNILSNAAKYTEQGTITVQTRQIAERVEIIVEDTGVGMSDENLKQLFIPFERFDNSLSVQSGGTGLGLYLTKKLLDDVLQGNITVESTNDKGSRFTVTLPITMVQKDIVNGIFDMEDKMKVMA